MTRWMLLASLLIAAPGWGLRAAERVDAIVVCPVAFQPTLQSWIQRRQAEGMQVCVLPSKSDAEALRTSICELATKETRYVMLVGDAPVIGTVCDPSRQTPILYCPTTVSSKWGSTAVLSSDMLFGDFDRDDLPDAVVGRLPVDRPEQLQSLITRITAHESSQNFGPWRGQVQVVGGVGGFGAIVDRTIESITRSIVTNVLPMETRTMVTYASPGHPFFPREPSFTDAVLNRYQQGSRFWVYAGHGRITELDRVPGTRFGQPVLDRQSVKQLNRPVGESPIALMLACYTGAMDAPDDSLAEEMVLCEGGPIAVLAGSRVTMPYGNTTAAVGLIDGIFTQRKPRLGDAWMCALTHLQCEQPAEASNTQIMIDAVAAMINPADTTLEDERREHMLLYNLIGDPTLRLNHPEPVTVSVPTGVPVGQPLEVSVSSPIEGTLTITVDRPLGSVEDGDPNQTTVQTLTRDVQADEPMQLSMVLPEQVKGSLVIRAHVTGRTAWASGAARTLIRPN